MSYNKFRLDINGLRAFAILSVVFYHFNVPYISGGFTGVDVFFVISGFLMTGIILERVDHRSILDFYIARFLRVAPALITVVFIVLIFGYFTLSTNEFELLAKNAISSLLFYSNNYYAAHSSYFDPSSEFNFLLHTWSLSVEWQFYITYPIIILAAKKTRIPVWTILSVLFTISLCLAITKATGTREDIFYLLPTRAWEMLTGGLVYILSVRCNTPDWMKNRDGYGIAIIMVGVITLNGNDYWPSYATFIPVLGTVIVLLANKQNSVFTSNKVAQWVGKVSYSVYLWHWPIVVIMKYYDIKFNALSISFGLIVSFLLGGISFRFIENTLRSRDKIKLNIIIFLSISVLAVLVSTTKGMSFRFSDTLKLVVEYRMDHSSWRPDTCFLNPEQNYSVFSQCPDKMSDKSFVVWGDSHAAHLMPGLRKVFGEKLDITQRTASLCAPLIGNHHPFRPHCKDINDRISQEIYSKKPHTVMLSALWADSPSSVRKYLPNTIKFLKKSGVKRIILVGPVPFWKKTLIDTLEETGINNSGTISWEMTDSERNLKIDNQYLSDLAKQEEIVFISSLDTLCVNNYCKAIVGHDTSYPVQYDNSHMTPEGSIWFFNELANSLILSPP
ncbi:acyltransferase family protein [Leminorella grimontii]|uniref:acyltransferase family protein n=1 Tax=Leminorella grimontii TaxID=82981 RepID=UPI00321F79DE